jgi:serine/threonine kinase PknH
MIIEPRHRVVIGATALSALAVLGGVGVALGNETQQAAGSQPARIDVTEVATTTTKPGSNAMGKLMGMLPKGYDTNTCGPVDNPPQDSLATLDCGQNALPNGPTGARFSLYPDQTTLNSHFETGAGADQIQPCPGGLDSPGNWHYNSTPDQAAGRIVCGTYQGKMDLMWSDNKTLMLGDLQGTDLESLYDFWTKNT